MRPGTSFPGAEKRLEADLAEFTPAGFTGIKNYFFAISFVL